MTSAEQIARLDAALAHFPVAYAFIGGGVLSLLVTDPSASARPVRAGDRTVRVVAAPYFVALKLEAFEDRGRNDMILSHDFEDVICLFDGRPEITDEIRAAPEDLQRYLSGRFARYLVAQDFEAAVEGFVQTDPSPDARLAAIVARFREVAALNSHPATP